MNKFFKLSERGTTVRTEIIAGVTTFMAMAYVLMVIPGMFSDIPGVSFDAMYVSTALSAVIGTLLIGLLANLPLAQASGIGLSAFFVYTVCLEFGLTYANALVFVLADGILFVTLTVTGLRRLIFDAIPACIKVAIPAGIGLFIAFLGMQSSGLIVDNPSNKVGLASFNLLGDSSWGDMMPLVVLVLAVFAIAILSKKGVKGAILWSMLGATAVYYLLGLTVDGFYDNFESVNVNPFSAFADFGQNAFGKVFTEGFDFSAYLSVEGNNTGSLIITFATSALAFCMVDMFDTLGTLYGACRGGNLLVKNEKGEDDIPNANRAMLSDALATCVGALCGTSTVTTYIEASAGVGAGGRTGLSAVVTAVLFFVAMFFSPIAKLIPACAYSAALIYVGVLMMACVKDIDWDKPDLAVPAFLTIVMMPFTYNISWGIAFGMLSYILIKAFSGRIKEISVGTWLVGALFLAMFLLTN